MKEFKEIPANERSLRQRKPVFGVGINDANYMVRIEIDGAMRTCPYYARWAKMLERCYCKKYLKKNPSYDGCYVCDEWLLFSNFKEWMRKKEWEGMELDKDLLFSGNKVYSPDRCIFIHQSLNTLLVNRKALRGSYSQGVYLNKKRCMYEANVSFNGKAKWIGAFSTEKEAFEAYKKEKYEIIRSIALEQEEPLKTALLNYRIK